MYFSCSTTEIHRHLHNCCVRELWILILYTLYFIYFIKYIFLFWDIPKNATVTSWIRSVAFANTDILLFLGYCSNVHRYSKLCKCGRHTFLIADIFSISILFISVMLLKSHEFFFALNYFITKKMWTFSYSYWLFGYFYCNVFKLSPIFCYLIISRFLVRSAS